MRVVSFLRGGGAGFWFAHNPMRRIDSAAEKIVKRVCSDGCGEYKLLERVTILTDSFRCLLISAGY